MLATAPVNINILCIPECIRTVDSPFLVWLLLHNGQERCICLLDTNTMYHVVYLVNPKSTLSLSLSLHAPSGCCEDCHSKIALLPSHWFCTSYSRPRECRQNVFQADDSQTRRDAETEFGHQLDFSEQFLEKLDFPTVNKKLVTNDEANIQQAVKYDWQENHFIQTVHPDSPYRQSIQTVHTDSPYRQNRKTMQCGQPVRIVRQTSCRWKHNGCTQIREYTELIWKHTGQWDNEDL